MGATASEGGKRRKTQRTWYRAKAHQWLLELDNALKSGDAGGGLKRFQCPANWRMDEAFMDGILEAPSLVVAADQGSDGQSHRPKLVRTVMFLP